MNNTTLKIPVPLPFDLQSALTAHGWASLLPNQFDREVGTFSRVEQLSTGSVLRMTIHCKEAHPEESFPAAIESTNPLNKKEREEIQDLLVRMLRLDEDLSSFYQLCEKNGPPWEVLRSGKGRLLRSPSVFEDLVKVILTTNIQWGGTKRMVKELVDTYGEKLPENGVQKSFPSSEKIAGDTLEKLKGKVNLGYRAEYIHELALDYANGKIADSDYLDSMKCTEEVRKNLLAIKGIGPYAAATMLMLLGRYDDIPKDTIFREFISRKYFQGGNFNKKEAQTIYDGWGKWKYLAYWFDDHK